MGDAPHAGGDAQGATKEEPYKKNQDKNIPVGEPTLRNLKPTQVLLLRVVRLERRFVRLPRNTQREVILSTLLKHLHSAGLQIRRIQLSQFGV